MPTPGAAPRGRMAREPQEACRGPYRASRSRRASRPPRTSPPRTPTPSRPGLPPSGSTCPSRRGRAIDGHVRLLLAWTDAINLTAIRDPADGRHRARHRQPVGRRSRSASVASTGSSTSVRAAASRACRSRRRCPAARGLLVEPVGKKARFLTTTIEATRPGLDRARRPRSGPRRSPATRRHRGHWPAVIARAVATSPTSSSWRSRCSSRAGSSSPGSGATSRPSWLPRTGRSPRSVAAAVEILPRHSPRPRRAIAWSSSRRDGRVRRHVSARPGRAESAGRGERAAARLRPCADRSPLRHPQQPRRPRRRPRRRRLGRRRPGISATSSDTARSRTQSSNG